MSEKTSLPSPSKFFTSLRGLHADAATPLATASVVVMDAARKAGVDHLHLSYIERALDILLAMAAKSDAAAAERGGE